MNRNKSILCRSNNNSLEPISDHIPDIAIKLVDEASPVHCLDIE